MKGKKENKEFKGHKIEILNHSFHSLIFDFIVAFANMNKIESRFRRRLR
jgi:hypothetical protein